MKLLPARTSIGVKLALQYGLTLLAAFSLFAFAVGSLVEARINGQAKLALQFQVTDLVDGYAEVVDRLGRDAAAQWLAGRASHRIEAEQASLGLGIELILADGARPVSVGSLAMRELPLDRRLAVGNRSAVLRAVNLGGDYAHLSLTEAVDGGFLRAAISTERFARNAADVRRIFLWSVPALLLVAGGAGWLLSRTALAPIASINAAARRIGSNAEGWIPTTGSEDELDRLAETLNEMVGRIRSGVDQLQRFSGNAAHELRSPLNRIVHHLDTGDTDAVRVEVDRMTRRIDALLRLSRVEQGLLPVQMTPVNVTMLVENVGSFFEPEAEALGLEFDLHCEGILMTSGDPEWLSTALSNLVSNAIKYNRPDGYVRIRAESVDRFIQIRVSDGGPGFPETEVEAIFERFERATQDHAVDGFGLGLPIAREIARAHGGDVAVSTKLGHGSTFTLIVPERNTRNSDGASA